MNNLNDWAYEGFNVIGDTKTFITNGHFIIIGHGYYEDEEGEDKVIRAVERLKEKLDKETGVWKELDSKELRNRPEKIQKSVVDRVPIAEYDVSVLEIEGGTYQRRYIMFVLGNMDVEGLVRYRTIFDGCAIEFEKNDIIGIVMQVVDE